jgi:hypothetical protein
VISSLIVALALTGAAPAADAPAASAKAIQRLGELHLADAKNWNMYLDEGHKTKAELVEKPIYVWTNPTRSRGQHGAVFVWNHRGRPVAVGSIFSHPETGQRMVCHEFHSLATGTLLPERGPDDQRWEPKAPIKFLPLPSAPMPDASPARRLIQMRSLARDFTAHSIDYQMERWELRLLGQPLYRYDKPEGDVVDGTLFAFVTSAGTDPEVIVVLEAHKSGDSLAWHYRAIRFSDSNLYVQHLGKEVWSSIRDDNNQLFFNPDHTYRLIRDRPIAELPELVAEQ